MNEVLAKKIEAIRISDRKERTCVGTIVAIDQDGHVMVDFPNNYRGPVNAYYTNAFKSQLGRTTELVHRKVLLVFDEDALDRPIIVDTLHSKIDPQPETMEADAQALDEIVVDGKRVRFDAEEEITLRCGKSTIRLSKSGKIVIRGTNLLNRSSGVNQIKGGSVQIN